MKKILNSKLTFIIPFVLLIFISLLNMHNAKFISSLYTHNFFKQLLWFILGIIIFLIVRKINLPRLFKISYFLYFLSLFFLVLVLFIGKTTNGAKAWLNLGLFSFQPSELMKLSLTIFLSNLATNYEKSTKKQEIIFISKILIATIIPSFLVFLEPDTGAILYFFLIALAILITTNIHKLWFIILILIICVLGISFILLYLFNRDLLISLIGTSFFYRVERLITFHTSSSYQLENALIAIGSAPLIKNGFHQISIYIPEAPTDFFFAFSIGNYGYLIGYLILLCYFIIDAYLINYYFQLKKSPTKFITGAFLSLFLFGQVINISMNIGLLPIIGIPLPFLSYGGSTLITYFIFLGLIFQNKSHLS